MNPDTRPWAVSLNEVTDWWVSAKPGDAFTYFHGDLSRVCNDGIPATMEITKDARNIREKVQSMAMAGQVFLLRRRSEPNVFNYTVVKSSGSTKSNWWAGGVVGSRGQTGKDRKHLAAAV